MTLTKMLLYSLVILTLSVPIYAKLSCTTWEDCYGINGMECKNNTCLCPAGKVLNSNGSKCIEVGSYILSPCEENIQCQSLFFGFHCNSDTKVCDCLEGNRYLEGRCWPTVKFGDVCKKSQECYDRLLPLSMECIGGKCSCKPDHYERLGGQCRKKATILKATCTLDSDCQIPNKNAVCTNMICAEKKSQSYEPLIEDNPKSEVWKKSTVRAVIEGNTCNYDDDCSDLNHSECSENICICQRNFYPSNDKKTCIGDLGQYAKSCKDLPMTHLEANTCLCNNGFFYDPYLRECIKPARNFDESCVNDDSCYTFGSSSICVKDKNNEFLKVCDCDLSVSYKDEELLACTVTRGIDETCSKLDNCPLNASCKEGICKCEEDFVASINKNQCLNKNFNLSETCELDEQCGTKNSICLDNKCSCAELYYQDEDICKPSIGGPCTTEDDCEIPNSSCTNSNSSETLSSNYCDCLEDLVTAENKCLEPVKSLGDFCDSDAHCWQTLGDKDSVACEEGKCQCTATHHERKDKCWMKTMLGEPCSISLQCFTQESPERTVCRRSVCSCEWGYVRAFAPDGCKDAGTAIFNHKISILIIIAILSIVSFNIYKLE